MPPTSLFLHSGLAGAQPGMFQSPGVQNLLSQVQSNPQMFENMMQSPHMQQMMTQMTQNPDLMSNVSKPRDFMFHQTNHDHIYICLFIYFMFHWSF